MGGWKKKKEPMEGGGAGEKDSQNPRKMVGKKSSATEPVARQPGGGWYQTEKTRAKDSKNPKTRPAAEQSTIKKKKPIKWVKKKTNNKNTGNSQQNKKPRVKNKRGGSGIQRAGGDMEETKGTQKNVPLETGGHK